MDLQNIQDQLNTEFSKEDTRIIFWFDDKGEYEDEVSELQMDNAKLHILDGTNWFYSKWLLNESNTESKYLMSLLYSHSQKVQYISATKTKSEWFLPLSLCYTLGKFERYVYLL